MTLTNIWYGFFEKLLKWSKIVIAFNRPVSNSLTHFHVFIVWFLIVENGAIRIQTFSEFAANCIKQKERNTVYTWLKC